VPCSPTAVLLAVSGNSVLYLPGAWPQGQGLCWLEQPGLAPAEEVVTWAMRAGLGGVGHAGQTGQSRRFRPVRAGPGNGLAIGGHSGEALAEPYPARAASGPRCSRPGPAVAQAY